MLPCSSETLTGFIDALCDAAAEETLPRFRTRTKVSNKLDAGFDPVTEADQSAERVIRALLQQKFPDHCVVGEEYGALEGSGEYQWIIDPIDGTRAFISGLPVWGTLIALYHLGKPIAGVLDQPFTRERYVAFDGRSTLKVAGGDAVDIQTSTVTSVSDATLMTTTPDILRGKADAGYFNVEKQTKLVRYGCDCYAYAMLASGNIDLVIESGLNIYDIAALIPIIENAGGVITNWQGESATLGGQILAAANAGLHAQGIELLNE